MKVVSEVHELCTQSCKSLLQQVQPHHDLKVSTVHQLA